MDASDGSIRVTISGKVYCIKADVDADTIKNVADIVEKKIVELKETSSVRDELKLAILTSMNIAGELYELQKKYDELNDTFSIIKSRTATIGSKIENSI